MASPKEEKVEPKGKAKVKKRKGNVSTKSQNLQNSGQADLGNSGQIIPNNLTPTVRTGEKMAGTQQSRVLKRQQQPEEFQRASFGELRLSNFDLSNHIESFQPDQLDPSQRTIACGIGCHM